MRKRRSHIGVVSGPRGIDVGVVVSVALSEHRYQDRGGGEVRDLQS